MQISAVVQVLDTICSFMLPPVCWVDYLTCSCSYRYLSPLRINDSDRQKVHSGPRMDANGEQSLPFRDGEVVCDAHLDGRFAIQDSVDIVEIFNVFTQNILCFGEDLIRLAE